VLQRVSRTVPSCSRNRSIRSVPASPRACASGRQRHWARTVRYSLSGKWVELLKEIVPGLKRIGVLRDGQSRRNLGQWAIIQAGPQQPEWR